MFNAIQKFLKRLVWTVGILLVAGLILVALVAPKLILNIGECGLLVWFVCLSISSFATPDEKKGILMPSDEELRRRWHKGWF